MATCGMYDFSGEWLFRVGLPAKSGVAGGLVAVSPSQFGIGLFSPRLDERGNSVRAVEASRAISERFSLHLMHQVERTAPSLRAGDRGRHRGGRARRAPARGAVAEDVPVLSLQGYIEFAAAEQALLAVRSHVGDDGPPAGDRARPRPRDPVPPGGRSCCSTPSSTSWPGSGVPVVTVDRQGRGMVAASAEFATRAEAAGRRPGRLSGSTDARRAIRSGGAGQRPVQHLVAAVVAGDERDARARRGTRRRTGRGRRRAPGCRASPGVRAGTGP